MEKKLQVTATPLLHKLAWKYKNKWLIREQGISFQEIADIILRGEYIDILENPTHPNQDIFLLRVHRYTWVVPFIIDEDESIYLITAFPSR
jgi:hypothetical protein